MLKSLEQGLQELLERVLRETCRKVVEADDALDAVVAMLTGSLQHGSLQALDGAPDTDDHGLPMCMLFRDAALG